MSSIHIHDHPGRRQKPASRLLYRLCCTAATLLLASACQWLPHDADQKKTEHWWPRWPWQQNETEPDAHAAKRQQKIDFLLGRGDLAFSKDRLTVPANDNAVLYYRTVFKLDPDNDKARKGLARVAKRYRDLAKTSHDNGDGSQARKYLKLAETVSGTNDPANMTLRKELQETPQGQNPRALDRKLQQDYKTQKGILEEKQRASQPVQ